METRVLSRVVGGCFCLHPKGRKLGGMGGFMNKYDLEVCGNSRSEMILLLNMIYSFIFDYHSLNQTKSLLTLNWPHGRLSHYTEKMRWNTCREQRLKLAFHDDVCPMLAAESYTVQSISLFQEKKNPHCDFQADVTGRFAAILVHSSSSSFIPWAGQLRRC